MKRFKDYLIESKQTYSFKVKIAGDDFKNPAEQIKACLSKFDPINVSKSITTPIQETCVDFPSHKNISVSVIDVEVAYPATTEQLRTLVAESLGLTHSCVVVRSLGEEYETELNHQYDNDSNSPVLGTDYEKENYQSLVGEEQKMALLKELSKIKHQGTQYKGVNDKILADKSPKEQSSSFIDTPNTKSPVGSKPTTRPTAKTFGGL